MNKNLNLKTPVQIAKELKMGAIIPNSVYVNLADVYKLIEEKRAIYEHSKTLQDLRHKWFDEVLKDLR